MGDSKSSRRRFLQATAGIVSTGALTGLGLAARPERIEVNVGYANGRGRQAAEKAAMSVKRNFAFAAKTIEVPRKALQGLTNNPNVRYVEANATVQAAHHKSWHSRGGKNEDTETATPTQTPTPTETSTPTPTETPTDTPTKTPTDISTQTPTDTPSGDDQTLPWGVDRIDANAAHIEGKTGAGVDVAILDTGIDADHPDLRPNLGTGAAIVDSTTSSRHAWDDDDGHGTHCAGTVAAANDRSGVVGVAPEATLHAVKVLDQNGNGTYADIATGLEYAADQEWDVANLSLAGGKSSLMEDACEYAYANDVLIVAAARNYCGDCVGYPAAEPEAIAVTAIDQTDSLAAGSPTHNNVEFTAPGVDVYSTVPGGYGLETGTSMAAAHVSGAAALQMADGVTNEEARTGLRRTAVDSGLTETEEGYGIVNAIGN